MQKVAGGLAIDAPASHEEFSVTYRKLADFYRGVNARFVFGEGGSISTWSRGASMFVADSVEKIRAAGAG